MTIFRTWMNYNYISQLPSSYAAVLFSFRLYFLALDHADLIHSADLFKVGNRLLFHRILQIKKRVRILVAALVRHIGDVDSLSSKDRRDLTDHVRNIRVEQADSFCHLKDSHVARRIVYRVLDITIF